MLPSVRAFLSGIIDYAGLFPPAKLPLDEAIRNYAEYRRGADGWMLGRFVIPAARLSELDPHAPLFSAQSPLSLSVLGRGGDTYAEFRAGVVADLDDVSAFRGRHLFVVTVDAYELKLPPSVRLGSNEAAHGLSGMRVFCEIPPTEDISYFMGVSGPAAGVKLRCGGLEASAFPDPDRVAALITACRDKGLSLKFTAGLHHPLRHYDDSVQATMHGFLNVFGAAVLAYEGKLTKDQIRAIIEDEDPSHFAFDQEGFRWKDLRAPTERIAVARRDFVTAFGSCSFDEPRDDLRALGILPTQ
jgi:hypothetical protein